MAHKLVVTKKGKDFIDSPAYGEILRSTLDACLEEKLSFNLTYLTWICKTASYLSGSMLPELSFNGADKTFSFATPELREFAAQNREIIEKALEPYIQELDAAPQKVLNEAEMKEEISNWWA
jgi:hypothetical protein